MDHRLTSIRLPPPERPNRKRPRLPVWIWGVVVAASVAGGVWMGLGLRNNQQPKPRQQEEQAVSVSGQGSGQEAGGSSSGAHPADGASSSLPVIVERMVVEAREKVADGDWVAAGRAYRRILELDPGNADAQASLALVEQRLHETGGTVEITVLPEGTEVEIVGVGRRSSPAVFTGVPYGRYDVVVSREGYETATHTIEVQDGEPVRLPVMELKPLLGQMEVVSEPKGAEFQVMRTFENEEVEVVEAGETPAKLESLHPGDYRVRMSMEGWPEYHANVKVLTNRTAAVSAVFARGRLNVTSDPIGAEVWLRESGDKYRQLGVTPMSAKELPVGRQQLELRYQDWQPIRRTVDVIEDQSLELEFQWQRAMVSFQSDPPGAVVYKGDQRLGHIRDVTPFQMELPLGPYEFRAVHSQLGNASKAAQVMVEDASAPVTFQFDYGSVTLESEPPGAAVVSNGVPLGRTPVTLPVVIPGHHRFAISRENFRSTEVAGTVEPAGALNFAVKLKAEPAPATNRNFRNGLGQEMVWFGAIHGWVASHETTQAQYERVIGANPSYFKNPDHPVDSVTWYQAVKFCEALTVQERGLGNVPENFRYRLPTDKEWSIFVGEQKLDGAVSSFYERRASTAPVGSLAPNEFGLYDVRGNVWEWVMDWYSQTTVNDMRKAGGQPTPEWVGTDRKILRGGAWNRSSQFDLDIANRVGARPSSEDRYDVGFRVVLVQE